LNRTELSTPQGPNLPLPQIDEALDRDAAMATRSR